MRNNSLLIVALSLSATIFSCHKKDKEVICVTPNTEVIQGSWKQDYSIESVFQPFDEWEKVEFRNDSFFMKINVYPEILTAEDCYMTSWSMYTKGTYYIDSTNIQFNGVITDSAYVKKIDGCHKNGEYRTRMGIALCGNLLTLKLLITGSTIPEEKLKIKMYRVDR